MPLYADPRNPLNFQVPDLSAIIDSFAEGGIDPSEPEYTPYQGAAEKYGSSQSHGAGGLTAENIFNPDGSISGRAATFATDSDLADYAKRGSLVTGDNGKGAFGANTAGSTPYVAIPRDILAKVYGSERAAAGKKVEVTSPNGRTAIVEIGDIGPRLANRRNNAVLELNSAATQLLGSGDANGYTYRFVE